MKKEGASKAGVNILLYNNSSTRARVRVRVRVVFIVDVSKKNAKRKNRAFSSSESLFGRNKAKQRRE